uniref:B30.2/SPRY domain-containing protein n=1 Tax=Amphilophus citrinellus TaxID=61819 RepID=A0A3Q0R792_AMPCI
MILDFFFKISDRVWGLISNFVLWLSWRRHSRKKKLFEAKELKWVQQYAVDVTLDPDTAHPNLILSDDGKQVNHSELKKNLPDNSERFTLYCNVLGKQNFFSGRFYFEVQVKGKAKWDLGVAKESIDRKGKIILSAKNRFRSVALRNGNEYRALTGVFVDYEEGLVSFHDVDTASLIYSFTNCSFTQKLHPYFSLYCRRCGSISQKTKIKLNADCAKQSVPSTAASLQCMSV